MLLVVVNKWVKTKYGGGCSCLLKVVVVNWNDVVKKSAIFVGIDL